MNSLLLSLALLAPQQTEVAPPRSLVQLGLIENETSVRELQALDFDIAGRLPQSTSVQILADAGELERLRSLGLDYTVLQPDLAAFYAERAANDTQQRSAPALGAFLSPGFGSGSMGGFYTFAEVVSVLDQITAAFPSLTTDKFSIGQSIQGREIWAVKVSDNPDVDENEAEVRFDAVHHAREPESMQATIWALLSLLEGYGTDPQATYIIDNREIWFIPIVNPDGYVYNQTTNPNGGGLWRKNRRNNGGNFGVDLNRNYSFEWGFDNVGSSPTTSSETYRGTGPASEPEVAAMQAFIDSRNFGTVLTSHCFSDLWLFPLGYIAAPPLNESEYQEISDLATEVNNYLVGPAGLLLYTANGVTDDYDHGTHGTHCWTPEIGSSSDGFWPLPSRIVPLAMENELAFRRTALAAGAYIHEETTDFTDLGDGDGNFEAGESFDILVNVRNSGRDNSGSVSVAITSADPNLIINTGSAVVGNVGSFASGTHAGTPLSFTIGAGAASGSQIDYSLEISYEGYTEVTDHTLAVGEERDFLLDTVESDLGWTAGLPGDNATTGLWEHGDPVGTSSGGQPSNPGNDATPGAGVNCFATGNGSTSAGGDDVDNGLTTLITPAIDLSGLSSAVIGYSRWYANLSTLDDDFEVSISDDDGFSWTPLETLSANVNQWTEVSFDVGSFVSLTDQVRLRFIAQDDPNNSLTEAGIDDLFVRTFESGPRITIYGEKAINSTIAPHVAGDAGDGFILYGSTGTALISLGNVEGDILIDPSTLFQLQAGTIPASGLFRNEVLVPNDPTLVGMTFYVQALLFGNGLKMSNRVDVTF